MRINLYDLDRPALTALLAEWDFSAYHAQQLWHALYRDGVASFAALDGLRADLRARLSEETTLERPSVTHARRSDDKTRKYLLALADGQTVETVLMRYNGRMTACISTQAGCAMGCVFCATGQMGFARHLTPGEIVGQILHVNDVLATDEHGAEKRDASRRRLRNIVLMGMGEPLHNYDQTLTAVDILTDHHGLALAPRYITLSTVGVVPGIRRLADEGRKINLAVSLHGATDAERNKLVPLGRRWPLAALIDACRDYIARTGRRIFFEWTLIAGQNDTPQQAHALGQLLHGLDAHVNLIPLNPTAGFVGAPSRSPAARHFQSILAEYELPSTIRRRRGIDIDAGCGQLRAAVTTP